MPEIVRCEACGFGYSAEHTNADGTYSCPLCELAAAEAALTVAETHIAKLRRVLLHHWGTTDPELLAEVWEDRAPRP